MKTKHRVRVRVGFKEGILDPQAEVIDQQIQQMEFVGARLMACEKAFVLEIEKDQESEAIETAREIAQKLLTNVVMESFEIEAIS